MTAPRVIAAALILALSGACASASKRGVPARPTSTIGATIEAADPRLAAALLTERAVPSAESHLQVAREYIRLGVLDVALKRAERALRIDPESSAAHETIARIWRDWGWPAAALVPAHRAVFHEPGSSSAHNTLGTVLAALGETDGARAAFTKAFALDGSAAWALSNLCYLEYREGRLTQAARHCEAAVRASPGLTAAYNNLGLTHAATGAMDQAQVAFLGGGDAATAHFNMGIVHLAQGRDSEAAASFGRALDARPDFTQAKVRAHQARMRLLHASDR
jgi:Tfp pilus assembly protein PilF